VNAKGQGQETWIVRRGLRAPAGVTKADFVTKVRQQLVANSVEG
jgi:hypothetical protein